MSNYIFVEKPNPGKCPDGTKQRNLGDIPACQSSCGGDTCSGYPGISVNNDNKIQFAHSSGTFIDPKAVYFSKVNGKCVMWSTDPNGKRVSTEVPDQDCCDGNGKTCKAGEPKKVLLSSYMYDCNGNCETGCDPKNRKGCCLRGSDKCGNQPGGKYKCTVKDGCTITPDGKYDTIDECVANEPQCGGTRPKRWSCDGKETCNEDINGPYTSKPDCDLQCSGVKPSNDTGNNTVKILVGIAVVIAIVIVLLIVYTFIVPMFKKGPQGSSGGFSPKGYSPKGFSPRKLI
jgi:hypothetical protein